MLDHISDFVNYVDPNNTRLVLGPLVIALVIVAWIGPANKKRKSKQH